MKQRMRIDKLNELVVSNNYWLTLEQLEKRLKRMLEDLSSQDFDTYPGIISRLPNTSRNFFSNNIALHFPFSLIDELDGLPSFISNSDIELLYKNNKPTDLNLELVRFKYESLVDVLKVVKGELPAVDLEKRVYNYLDSFRNRPELDRLFQIEQELLKAKVDSLLLEDKRSPFFSVILSSKQAENYKRVFSDIGESGKSISIGMFGTLYFLLFMNREISERNIHRIKTELLKIDKHGFSIFPFHLKSPSELTSEELKKCIMLENELASELKKSFQWMEEHHHRIMTRLYPDQEIELSVSFTVIRKDYNKTLNMLQDAFNNPSVFLKNNYDGTSFKIERVGKSWNIEFKGQKVFLNHKVKKNRYLCTLLENPNKEIPALNLYSGTDSPEILMDSIASSNFDDYLDNEAIAQFKARIVAIDEELFIKEETGADDRRLQEEREIIAEELMKSYYCNNKMKKPEINKARDAVQKGVKRAIEDINDLYPELAHYLRIHIKTGEYCIYKIE